MAAQGKILIFNHDKKDERNHDFNNSCYTLVSDKGAISWTEYIISIKAIVLRLVYSSSFSVQFICITNTFRQINLRSLRTFENWQKR